VVHPLWWCGKMGAVGSRSVWRLRWRRRMTSTGGGSRWWKSSLLATSDDVDACGCRFPWWRRCHCHSHVAAWILQRKHKGCAMKASCPVCGEVLTFALRTTCELQLANFRWFLCYMLAWCCNMWLCHIFTLVLEQSMLLLYVVVPQFYPYARVWCSLIHDYATNLPLCLGLMLVET
jgi:hypothetical protein